MFPLPHSNCDEFLAINVFDGVVINGGGRIEHPTPFDRMAIRGRCHKGCTVVVAKINRDFCIALNWQCETHYGG
jgi:hypothetical protein